MLRRVALREFHPSRTSGSTGGGLRMVSAHGIQPPAVRARALQLPRMRRPAERSSSGSSEMECAGEAAFDDLVALAQVGTRGEVKMEMASNYWDEMGRGKTHAVHTHLFHRLIEGLETRRRTRRAAVAGSCRRERDALELHLAAGTPFAPRARSARSSCSRRSAALDVVHGAPARDPEADRDLLRRTRDHRHRARRRVAGARRSPTGAPHCPPHGSASPRG